VNRLDFNAVALALGVSFGADAVAQGLSRVPVKPGNETTATRYAVAKQKCDAYADVARDFCLGQARARFGKS
jgi:hypothetical protein